MNDENSFHFWIIPIVCGIGMIILLSVMGVNYVTHTLPLAEKQQQEILHMTCEEIENFPSTAVLYTPSNRKIFAESSEGCADFKKAIKEKENKLLQEKLKDPTSVESLLKKFKLQALLQKTFQKDYDYHFEESQKLYQNLTDANNMISEIQSHSNWSEVLKRLNDEK